MTKSKHITKTVSLELSESEIHVLRLAINTSVWEWDDYLRDLPVQKNSGDWLARNQIQTVKKRVLQLASLTKRLQKLAIRVPKTA